MSREASQSARWSTLPFAIVSIFTKSSFQPHPFSIASFEVPAACWSTIAVRLSMRPSSASAAALSDVEPPSPPKESLPTATFFSTFWRLLISFDPSTLSAMGSGRSSVGGGSFVSGLLAAARASSGVTSCQFCSMRAFLSSAASVTSPSPPVGAVSANPLTTRNL